MRSRTSFTMAVVAAAAFLGGSAAHAETVMQQCGQQYQAAKAGGTLNGMTWNQFRTDCAAKMKAQPASTTAPASPEPAPAPASAANPLSPEPASAEPTTTKVAAPASAGRAAFVARERQCGSEWRANKVTLIAQTPGLSWPKYLSSCNKRLKGEGK